MTGTSTDPPRGAGHIAARRDLERTVPLTREPSKLEPLTRLSRLHECIDERVWRLWNLGLGCLRCVGSDEPSQRLSNQGSVRRNDCSVASIREADGDPASVLCRHGLLGRSEDGRPDVEQVGSHSYPLGEVDGVHISAEGVERDQVSQSGSDSAVRYASSITAGPQHQRSVIVCYPSEEPCEGQIDGGQEQAEVLSFLVQADGDGVRMWVRTAQSRSADGERPQSCDFWGIVLRGLRRPFWVLLYPSFLSVETAKFAFHSAVSMAKHADRNF